MRKYYFDENYFENINTEDKAYWLGFIAADGCIVSTNKKTKSLRLLINLHEKDVAVLEKLRDCLNGDMPIKHFVSNKGKVKMESQQVRIHINSNKLCEDLISHGVGFKKTFDLAMPNIREDLIRHFIRGYFDGDGCFTCYRRKDNPNKYRYGFEIVGQSESILKYMQDYFIKRGIKTNIYSRSTNTTKRLMTGSKGEILKLIDLMYSDCNLYIERKYPSQIIELAA